MEENKFNFSEEEKSKEQDNAAESTKDAVKKDAQGLWVSIKRFFSELLDFREDTDRDATLAAIKGDIPFKGATAWILICSIFVASIGLNANSAAVVIGAMLISPLMGPILGVGLSIAINDIDTLKRSLINLVIMIVLSLTTAFLFFKFFPLSEDTSELLGRVKPDIRDVLIAFFGGLALIIARTKKGTIASVIFGVAIATALMPPLCTAGYGLAKGNFPYFFGAMYLFTINTIFIALATFIVVKILGFPMLKYANSAKRKRTSRIATLVAVVVMIPAMITFIDVWRQSKFENAAQAFINKELEGLPHADYIKSNAGFKYSGVKDTPSVLEFNSFGLDQIPENTIAILRSRMKDYPALVNAKLEFNQNRSKNLDNLRYMSQLRYRDSLDLLTQNQKIVFLEDKVRKLAKYEALQIPFEELTKEVNINYENIDRLSYSSVISSNFKQLDTISEFTVKWKENVNEAVIAKEQQRLKRWLQQKYKMDSLVVRRQK
ncbi:putative hydrophobic protein (TIGR00271 family) [Gelidibacter algens]|uniref:Putative hydrophobic protein (TIGR00271 family) n=1 Tax=Gelidibacter algens TaxID=49280 RepID=A0A1A7R0P1_9FLAO|nr:DUF389 domain-containing protein [Gelidibacter algens]OBX25820.1 hypothetical protein A9996_07770 [Gelidibacter algens]RAJ19114.1 putative hydrophobic protein (TIGR00271 family) [Gelidibacter algens]